MIVALALAATPVDLLPRGATWSYLDSGVDPGPTWVEPSFDDSAWATGPAPLGYGVFEATTVSYGGVATQRHPTTWFRAEVTVADPSLYTGLTLELRRDDGAVVYLNGTEVVRSNLPAASTSATLATADVLGLDESTFTVHPVDLGHLVAGVNTVAVEVHQASASSDDLALDLALVGWTGPPAISRGPYLQNGTPHSAVVRWRTDVPSVGSVTVDGRTVTGPLALDHSIAVDGLDPATAYPYSVAADGAPLAGGDPLHTLTTLPLPGDDSPVRIWVVGDSGTANTASEAVYDAFSALGDPPDVWLMLGDNAYNSGTDDEYQRAVFNLYTSLLPNTFLWPALGNHDGYTASSVSQTGPFFDIFTLPTVGEAGGEPSGTEAYYSFDVGPVHFICLDSYDSDRSPAGAMLRWLEDDLAATQATWVIAYWHHPPYSYGSHNSDFELQMVEMREYALPILEAWGVDLVLTGHSHSYERSVLLDGHYDVASTLDPTMIRDGGDGDPLGDGAYTKPSAAGGSREGAVYVVSGAGGQTSGGPLNHPAMVTSLNVLGSVIIDVDGAVMEVQYLDDQGAIRDSFQIVRGETSILEAYADGPVVEGRAASFHAYAVDPSGDEVVSYDWEFGDGHVASGADVVHLWPDDGRFDVTLTVVDASGASATRVLPIDVANLAPVFTDVGADPAQQGVPVRLWADATDVAADTVSINWDFGDGGSAYGGDVEHLFLDAGAQRVTVTATDEDGGLATSSFDLVVAALPPDQQVIYVSPAEEGRPTALVAGADPDVVAWSWDFHDGGPLSTTQATEHVWPDDGQEPVTLTVTDRDGALHPTLITVSVANVAPYDLQIGAPAGGDEGAPLAFVAQASDPGDDVLQFVWTFGLFGAPSLGPTVEHRFDDDGPYTVTLEVDDGDGGVTEQSFAVDIRNVAPVFTRLTAPSELLEGAAAPFVAAAFDPADPVTVTWDFGDGALATGDEQLRSFPDDGRFEVTVRADDGDGGVASDTLTVVVHNVAPLLVGEPPTTAIAGEPYLFAPAIVDPGADVHTFTLDGPAGATVGPAGAVRWTPSGPFRGAPFALTVSDGDAAHTVRWSVDVAPPPVDAATAATDAGCGCATPAGRPWALAAGLLLTARRRRAGPDRRPTRA